MSSKTRECEDGVGWQALNKQTRESRPDKSANESICHATEASIRSEREDGGLPASGRVRHAGTYAYSSRWKQWMETCRGPGAEMTNPTGMTIS